MSSLSTYPHYNQRVHLIIRITDREYCLLRECLLVTDVFLVRRFCLPPGSQTKTHRPQSLALVY